MTESLTLQIFHKKQKILNQNFLFDKSRTKFFYRVKTRKSHDLYKMKHLNLKNIQIRMFFFEKTEQREKMHNETGKNQR